MHYANRLVAILAFPSVLTLGASLASAHVIVTPNQVGVAKEQAFSISVPSERDSATTALRLVIPSGLDDVMPTIQAGWTITTKADAQGAITEIDWTGGTITSGQRDDFTFQAQAPATATTLAWKAYQTYADGTVVSWDQTPIAGREDDDRLTPYSTTTVINDLTTSTPSNADKIARSLAATGIVLALIAALFTIPRNRRR